MGQAEAERDESLKLRQIADKITEAPSEAGRDEAAKLRQIADEIADGPTQYEIIKTCYGFLSTKIVLSAVELDLFTELASEPMTKEQLEEQLGLHPRCSADYLDSLVALGYLRREDGVYRNDPVVDKVLDASKTEHYIGGALEWANEHQYQTFGELTETLKTGEPQSGYMDEDEMFDELYEDEDQADAFTSGMAGLTSRVANYIAESFEWEEYESVCDVGSAKGMVPVTVAEKNEHLKATAFDLPELKPISEEFISKRGMDDRVSFHPGDAFEDDLPRHDVFVLGRILHDFGLEKKKELIRSTYEAMPDDGALLIYGSLIDNDRRENVVGLMTSLYVMVDSEKGYDYTPKECQKWLQEIGFSEIEVRDIPGPETMVVAQK
ncbi:methyltransferase (plasmid) [Haloferax sp. S1W]|uniref:methyltransferase n=1 Tax=Haloferax sp. S1W TaxID=3377110 RepID=UPI0037C5C848